MNMCHNFDVRDVRGQIPKSIMRHTFLPSHFPKAEMKSYKRCTDTKDVQRMYRFYMIS